MRIYRKLAVIVTLAAVIALMTAIWSRGHFPDQVFRISDGQVSSLDRVLPDLNRASFIFVGELHTDVHHHDIQLRVIKALHERDAPVAIGLEMIEAGDQEALDRWVSGKMDEKDFAKVFNRNWPSGWIYYRDIFLYAREHEIPMIALNVPDEITEQVAREGFYSLSPEQLARLPGVSCNVDKDYEELMRRALEMHGTSAQGKIFTRFCEAQMVWDTTMAQRLIDYADRNGRVKAVVIAGNTHAWKHGIPEQIRRKDSEKVMRVILPEIPGRQTRHTVTVEEADYLWLAGG